MNRLPVQALVAAQARWDHALRLLGREPPVLQVSPPAGLSALLLCRGGMLGAIAGALGPEIDVLCALTIPVAVEFLLAGGFDGVIVDEGSLKGTALEAVVEVRRHGALNDLPVICVRGAIETDECLAAGATAHIMLPELVGTFISSAQDYRSLGELKRALRSLKMNVLADFHILEAHIAAARTLGEGDLKFALIKYIWTDARKTCPALGRTVMSLLNTLTRAEDLVVRLEDGSFALLFNGLGNSNHARILERLTAIIERSVVLAEDGVTALTPELCHAVVDIDDLSGASDLLNRLRERLQPVSSSV